MKSGMLFPLFAPIFFAAAAHAEPIYVQPGQCIMVGSQQVCAMAQPGTLQPAKSDVIYVCRFGKYADAETPEMKTWELIQLRVNDSGTKVETNLKNFGINGQEACEKDKAQKETGK